MRQYNFGRLSQFDPRNGIMLEYGTFFESSEV
jgi:hypothetical protein